MESVGKRMSKGLDSSTRRLAMDIKSYIKDPSYSLTVVCALGTTNN